MITLSFMTREKPIRPIGLFSTAQFEELCENSLNMIYCTGYQKNAIKCSW